MQRWDAADTGGRRRGHKDNKLKLSLLQTIRISAAENIVWGGLYIWFKEKKERKKEKERKKVFQKDLKWTTASSHYSLDVFPFTPCLSLLLYSVFSVSTAWPWTRNLPRPKNTTTCENGSSARRRRPAALRMASELTGRREGWVSHSQTTWGQTETWGPWVS